jgi:hypothetical protein
MRSTPSLVGSDLLECLELAQLGRRTIAMLAETWQVAHVRLLLFSFGEASLEVAAASSGLARTSLPHLPTSASSLSLSLLDRQEGPRAFAHPQEV